MIDFALALNHQPVEDERQRLINYRDRAFLVTLADTGLRVHEACGLRRGDIDWNESRAIVIGKGNKEAVVRFSNRSLQALKDYLGLRAKQDGATGKSLGSMAIFARHDKAVGDAIKLFPLPQAVRSSLSELARPWVKRLWEQSPPTPFATTSSRPSCRLPET